MENKKINIAELLKNCPKGMELDCVMFDNVTLVEVDFDNCDYPISISASGERHSLSRYGQWFYDINAKCVIFPKGKTTWEGFIPPCEFKDGDIISNGNFIAIFYKIGTPAYCKSPNIVYYHCYYSQKYCKFKEKLDFGIGFSTDFKYATEEENQKLFQAIEDNGYKWNAETKTLEKLIKPKFKVGEIIKSIKSDVRGTIDRITDSTVYISSKGGDFNFSLTLQDDWELVHNKFDINTLVPFDKVLVRLCTDDTWNIDFFGYYKKGFCNTNGFQYKQCIPYEGNEHLLGKTDDCDNFFKTWED